MQHPNQVLKHPSTSTTVEKSQIEQILALRESRKALADRLELIEKSLSEAETQIIFAIDSGANVANAGYAVSISETERRYPKWKEEFISVAGKAAADKVLEATPANVYRKLIIK